MNSATDGMTERIQGALTAKESSWAGRPEDWINFRRSVEEHVARNHFWGNDIPSQVWEFFRRVLRDIPAGCYPNGEYDCELTEIIDANIILDGLADDEFLDPEDETNVYSLILDFDPGDGRPRSAIVKRYDDPVAASSWAKYFWEPADAKKAWEHLKTSKEL